MQSNYCGKFGKNNQKNTFPLPVILYVVCTKIIIIIIVQRSTREHYHKLNFFVSYFYFNKTFLINPICVKGNVAGINWPNLLYYATLQPTL